MILLQKALVSKRYLFLTLSLLSLFLLYQLQNGDRFTRTKAPFDAYTPLPKPTDGPWTWSDRPIQFPLHTLISLPHGKAKKLPRVQHVFGAESANERSIRLERQKAVKDTFLRCWNSYRARAWMKDELSPVSGGGRNVFGGWSATLVDALDTLWIMGLKDEFQEATAAVEKIDFSTSTDSVINVFETTIRYLGGFLAAYDLSGEMQLLHKAVDIGEMLLVPFDTPNHMPITRWRWHEAAEGVPQEAPAAMLVSELGSLTMEFTRLSQLTGDPRWYDAVARITRLFDAQQYKTKLPGMWPVAVNAKDEDLTVDTAFTLGGMSDSLYEYFPKTFALLGGLEPVYKRLYEGSMSAAAQNLFFRPMTVSEEDILIAGDARAHYDGSPASLDPRGQHLTCFTGGMLALGGRLFQNDKHLRLAKQLTDGCVWAYNVTSVGVMPEIARFVPCHSKDSCPWNETAWTDAIAQEAGIEGSNMDSEDSVTRKSLPKGYTEMLDARDILRPEAIESVFYMYRITGDRSYLDKAWDMFSAVQRISQTEFANAAVSDITRTGPDGLPPKDDRMESFWLAETLKYAYLIFSEPEHISLDDYVLNTEAHPFKRPV